MLRWLHDMKNARTLIAPFGFLRDRTARVVAVAAFAVLGAHWLFVLAFVIPRLGTLHFLRLHYAATSGVDWVDVWWYIFVFPVFGAAAFFANLAIAAALAKKHRVLGIAVLAATAGIEIALAAAGGVAILLNG